jgi:hypothetical protein
LENENEAGSENEAARSPETGHGGRYDTQYSAKEGTNTAPQYDNSTNDTRDDRQYEATESQRYEGQCGEASSRCKNSSEEGNVSGLTRPLSARPEHTERSVLSPQSSVHCKKAGSASTQSDTAAHTFSHGLSSSKASSLPDGCNNKYETGKGWDPQMKAVINGQRINLHFRNARS